MMRAQPPRPGPDDPPTPDLMPPADPWSAAPLPGPDPLFPMPPQSVVDPLAPPSQPLGSPPAPAQPSSPAPAQPSSPAPAQPSSPAQAQPLSPAPARPSLPAPAQPSSPEPSSPDTAWPPTIPLPSPYIPPAPQPPAAAPPPQPWQQPASEAPHQPDFPPRANPAPAPDRPVHPDPAAGYQPPPVTGIPQPYAQAPYAHPGTLYAGGPVRSLRTPSRTAIGALAVTTIYCLLLRTGLYSYGNSASGWIPGQALAAVAGYAALVIFTIIAFMVWLHRASANLWSTGHAMTWRPGWTVAAWLIPVANLVLPLLVVREVDRATRDHGPGLFALWAGSWSLSLFLNRSSSVLTPYAGVSLFESLALTSAGVAAILLIRRVTADQEHLTRSA
ncbi:DUF4328 domain-containing protein [Actinoplanes sp. NPDC020271]|uniref:DUF4328 domain-containing protein n=1 Tax=Actinoplanes sp. NPDC020271 TaxID=3363896 RepID=UPI00379530AE